MDCQGAQKSQKEGQDDQEEVKEAGGPAIAVLRSPDPRGLPSGSFWAPWQSIKGLYKALRGFIRP